MGGDHAPGAVLDGALQAAQSLGVGVVLTGPIDLLRGELARRDQGGSRVRVVDAPDVIGMNESPLAMRR
jgi:glycerol-3-phosphate acyltransferase PlsX